MPNRVCQGETPIRPFSMLPRLLPLAAAQFGAYRAVELIGRGGMSAVYRARRTDGQFDQTVALKIMASHLAGPEFLRRFLTERQLLASLNHNHITRLLDGGVSSTGDPYLITELVEGQTIDEYCDERRLGVESRLLLVLQVSDAVDYAHRSLIIHRDLKPRNILVNTEGAVKLLDFGTAQLLAGATDITLARERMLTPRYASPEQLRGDRVNITSDVFSLAVVAYELLAGAWPFGNPGSILSELHRAVGECSVSPPHSVVTGEAAKARSALRGSTAARAEGRPGRDSAEGARPRSGAALPHGPRFCGRYPPLPGRPARDGAARHAGVSRLPVRRAQPVEDRAGLGGLRRVGLGVRLRLPGVRP